MLSPKKTSIKQVDNHPGNNAKSQVIILSKKGVEPKNGWFRYEQYLVNQVSYSRYDDGNLVTGETIVSFEIDANMEAVNFQFEKSIDEEVNDAVKEFIKFGPDWKNTTSRITPHTVKLKIIF